jgi:hypothetical protein
MITFLSYSVIKKPSAYFKLNSADNAAMFRIRIFTFFNILCLPENEQFHLYLYRNLIMELICDYYHCFQILEFINMIALLGDIKGTCVTQLVEC